jgi:hypothetical protein
VWPIRIVIALLMLGGLRVRGRNTPHELSIAPAWRLPLKTFDLNPISYGQCGIKPNFPSWAARIPDVRPS